MTIKRLDWNEYFFRLADVAASRSSCLRRQVGAIIVRDHTVVSTGYNGTPQGMRNCNEGGCPRCAGTVPSGTGYDSCTCVHAEQNAIALAARYGYQTEGAHIYLTAIEPCLSCLKSIRQAGIVSIYVGVPSGHTLEWMDHAYTEVLMGKDGLSQISLCVIGRTRLELGENNGD